jgi:hypothetical protein
VVDLALAAPADTTDLYLGIADDVPLARPVLPGDVFRGADIGEGDGLVLVVAHPCSMRGNGGQLRARIPVAPVGPYSSVSFDKWPTSHFNRFPLPDLLAGAGPQAGDLLALDSVGGTVLKRSERIACLTDRSIYILQQRFVHSLTRVVVGLDQLEKASGHVLAEAELEEEWIDALADLEDADTIDTEVARFAEFMDDGLRDQLEDPASRTDVRRQVRIEIDQRASSS